MGKNDFKATKKKRNKTIAEHKKVKARNPEQERFIEYIDRAKVIFAIGPAGTGKTYVSVRKGIESIILGHKKKFKQIRPAVTAGEDIGHLPGTLDEKMHPYHGPIHEILTEIGQSSFDIDKLYDENRIEILSIGYARGYTFNDCYVLVTEAQNMSPEQMKMILTRIGNNCTMVIEGDVSQHDLKGKASGLEDAFPRFEKLAHRDIKTVKLIKIEREPLIVNILKAYEDE